MFDKEYLFLSFIFDKNMEKSLVKDMIIEYQNMEVDFLLWESHVAIQACYSVPKSVVMDSLIIHR